MTWMDVRSSGVGRAGGGSERATLPKVSQLGGWHIKCLLCLTALAGRCWTQTAVLTKHRISATLKCLFTTTYWSKSKLHLFTLHSLTDDKRAIACCSACLASPRSLAVWRGMPTAWAEQHQVAKAGNLEPLSLKSWTSGRPDCCSS